ncbi:MAG: peptide chain release factor 2 [Deltaproteobacteria bacterium]|nr:peptide chain release factor 2 [Deltaproteobacteria bacterium]
MSDRTTYLKLESHELNELEGRLRTRLTELRGVFDEGRLEHRREELEQESASPTFWDDPERAEKLLKEKGALEAELANFANLEEFLDEALVLFELSIEAEDEETRLEGIDKLCAAEKILDEAELKRLLGGPHDRANAILSINSGEGGTDACDWADMLLRMYLRWAEKRGFKSEILDIQAGDEAGIRSATVMLRGDYAYGYLGVETGVHRLVRISPFGSGGRRQTSFASVAAMPEIDDTVEIDIDDSDLRVDTYRSSGAGGQHVNKTDSAVRLTHIPSGIVVQCQNERSQHKNRASAMKVLQSKLFEKARLENEAKAAALRGDQMNIGFGSQIRSYTLNPTQRIKDHRTQFEIGNVGPVLDGDIDGLIRAALLWRAGTLEGQSA